MVRRTFFATVLAIGSLCAQQLQQPQLPVEHSSNETGLDTDGPGRGVARISLVNGDVSLRRGDSSELITATQNTPVMVGDTVVTNAQSRAELQLDHSNMLRIGAMAQLKVSELEFRRYMLQLTSGTVTFRVLRNSDAQVELGTPSVAIRPVHKGIYRVTVRQDGTSEITVRLGTLEVYTPRGTEQLHPGQTMLARGGQNDAEFQVLNAPYEDEWDRWNLSRDAQLEHSSAYQYVSPEVYGAEDLDGQGQWVNNSSYGQVWSPNATSTDWAPYRNGRWVWEDYYGWTWVSYDSWGWAPYHYGRWFWDTSYGWCWWPGARGAHHYWRPALVGFFGFGSGYGSIGWVPLAPYEPFHPWWGVGIYGGYRNGFNGGGFGASVNLMAVYRNARYEHAVTGIAVGQFGRGPVNAQTMTRVTRGDLMNSGMVRGALPVSPDRSSLHVVDRAPRAGSYPPNTGRIFSTHQASPLNRVPFEQQRLAINSGVGQWHPPASYQPSYQQPLNRQSPQPMRMSPTIVQPRPNMPSYSPASQPAPQYRQPAPPPSRQVQPPPPSGDRGGGASRRASGEPHSR